MLPHCICTSFKFCVKLGWGFDSARCVLLFPFLSLSLSLYVHESHLRVLSVLPSGVSGVASVTVNSASVTSHSLAVSWTLSSDVSEASYFQVSLLQLDTAFGAPANTLISQTTESTSSLIFSSLPGGTLFSNFTVSLFSTTCLLPQILIECAALCVRVGRCLCRICRVAAPRLVCRSCTDSYIRYVRILSVLVIFSSSLLNLELQHLTFPPW